MEVRAMNTKCAFMYHFIPTSHVYMEARWHEISNTSLNHPFPPFLSLFLFMNTLKLCFEEHSCKDFRCAAKEHCISKDLLCDNVAHCEDGSDEAIGTLCEGKSFS
jgi:hypothetical protein